MADTQGADWEGEDTRLFTFNLHLKKHTAGVEQ